MTRVLSIHRRVVRVSRNLHQSNQRRLAPLSADKAQAERGTGSVERTEGNGHDRIADDGGRSGGEALGRDDERVQAVLVQHGVDARADGEIGRSSG